MIVPLGEAQIYKVVAGRPLRAFVVKPNGWKASDERPAVVFFHGGGWVIGSPSQFNEQAKHFAARGVVCVTVEYRLIKPKNELPAHPIQDAKSAMRWVRAQAKELGIDPKRIAGAGGSAGGHLAAFTALVPGIDAAGDDLKVSPRPDGLLLFNPVFDNGPGQYGFDRVGERYLEFSPAHHISPQAPPTIVMLGTVDKLIPVSVVENFQSLMTKAGVRCDAKFYEGQGHGFFNFSAENPDKASFRQPLLAADEFLVSLGWLTPNSK